MTVAPEKYRRLVEELRTAKWQEALMHSMSNTGEDIGCSPVLLQELHNISRKTMQGTAWKNGQPSEISKCARILRFLQHLSTFQPPKIGLEAMIGSQLEKMIAEMWTAIIKFRSLGEKNNAHELQNEILATVCDISRCSTEGLDLMANTFMNTILAAINDKKLHVSIVLEALKVANMFLEEKNSDAKYKQDLVRSPELQRLLKNFSALINTTGDYETQVNYMELLFRLLNSKERAEKGKLLFKDSDLHKFEEIKETAFESGCRMFLNSINASTRSVCSFECVSVKLGTEDLRKPGDDMVYQNFWIDFNLGSQRITFYCLEDTADDRQLWETVSIPAKAIVKYDIEEESASTTCHLDINAKSVSCSKLTGNHMECKMSMRFPGPDHDVQIVLSRMCNDRDLVKAKLKKMSETVECIPICVESKAGRSFDSTATIQASSVDGIGKAKKTLKASLSMAVIKVGMESQERIRTNLPTVPDTEVDREGYNPLTGDTAEWFIPSSCPKEKTDNVAVEQLKDSATNLTTRHSKSNSTEIATSAASITDDMPIKNNFTIGSLPMLNKMPETNVEAECQSDDIFNYQKVAGSADAKQGEREESLNPEPANRKHSHVEKHAESSLPSEGEGIAALPNCGDMPGASSAQELLADNVSVLAAIIQPGHEAQGATASATFCEKTTASATFCEKILEENSCVVTAGEGKDADEGPVPGESAVGLIQRNHLGNSSPAGAILASTGKPAAGVSCNIASESRQEQHAATCRNSQQSDCFKLPPPADKQTNKKKVAGRHAGKAVPIKPPDAELDQKIKVAQWLQKSKLDGESLNESSSVARQPKFFKSKGTMLQADNLNEMTMHSTNPRAFEKSFSKPKETADSSAFRYRSKAAEVQQDVEADSITGGCRPDSEVMTARQPPASKKKGMAAKESKEQSKSKAVPPLSLAEDPKTAESVAGQPKSAKRKRPLKSAGANASNLQIQQEGSQRNQPQRKRKKVVYAEFPDSESDIPVPMKKGKTAKDAPKKPSTADKKMSHSSHAMTDSSWNYTLTKSEASWLDPNRNKSPKKTYGSKEHVLECKPSVASANYGRQMKSIPCYRKQNGIPQLALPTFDCSMASGKENKPSTSLNNRKRSDENPTKPARVLASRPKATAIPKEKVVSRGALQKMDAKAKLLRHFDGEQSSSEEVSQLSLADYQLNPPSFLSIRNRSVEATAKPLSTESNGSKPSKTTKGKSSSKLVQQKPVERTECPRTASIDKNFRPSEITSPRAMSSPVFHHSNSSDKENVPPDSRSSKKKCDEASRKPRSDATSRSKASASAKEKAVRKHARQTSDEDQVELARQSNEDLCSPRMASYSPLRITHSTSRSPSVSSGASVASGPLENRLPCREDSSTSSIQLLLALLAGKQKKIAKELSPAPSVASDSEDQLGIDHDEDLMPSSDAVSKKSKKASTKTSELTYEKKELQDAIDEYDQERKQLLTEYAESCDRDFKEMKDAILNLKTAFAAIKVEQAKHFQMIEDVISVQEEKINKLSKKRNILSLHMTDISQRQKEQLKFKDNGRSRSSH